MNSSSLSTKLGLYGALIAAWVATMGSLYFSEVNGFIPCTLCWYQRILMYPLAGLLTLGILRRDHHLPHLVLPFSLLGQGVSVYHFLLQKTPFLGSPSSCGVGVTCSTVWIDWFGVVTIPLLAMVGFMIITTGMLMVIAGEPGGAGKAWSVRWPRWPAPLIVLIALALYTAGAARAGMVQISLPEFARPIVSELPFVQLSAGPTATPAPTVTPTSLENGASLYSQACASCHGQNGVGVEGLGTALANSPQVSGLTESEMFAIIRDGRAADAPQNRTGIAMPPSGGQPNLTDVQIVDIILYIQSLQ
ncbi:MAG: disulfide oxidoreductase [Caldilineaceae bacterium]|nr:disulfide oxidoreductase [Caldilineaceae bacterium]